MPDREGVVDTREWAAARLAFASFPKTCRLSEYEFSLTPRAEASSYARCFGLFNLRLIQQQPEASVRFAEVLRSAMRRSRDGYPDKPKDKSYRQLLTFTLSALSALEALSSDPLADLIEEQIPRDVGVELQEMGCLVGEAGSGNQAMFLAIFLLHGRDWLGLDTQSRIDEWVGLHLKSMNRFGFWGADTGMTHLQFQNGYHQHEILEYLGIENPRVRATVEAVRSLADDRGHFAPYPGGGGCYDYDAVFMLTPGGEVPDEETRALLVHTAANLMAEQRPDGGFAESLFVRPRTLANLGRFASHVVRVAGNPSLFRERLRYALTLQRPKHDRIHTHWSRYSRCWGESDLWDSWFRMLALARIQVALDPSRAETWGFMNYPGIGFHPAARG